MATNNVYLLAKRNLIELNAIFLPHNFLKMKKGVYFKNKKKYLEVTIYGVRSIVDVKKYGYIARQECEKHNLNKVLINGLNVENSNFSLLTSFLSGEILSKIFTGKRKVVIIWPKEHMTNILEVVASNNGVEMKVVPDINTGVEWLLQTKENWFKKLINFKNNKI